MKTLNPNQMMLEFKQKDPFDAWAQKYFNKNRLDKMVPRIPAVESLRNEVKLIRFSPRRFELELHAWCIKKGYEFNPSEFFNESGRIIRKSALKGGKQMAYEMIYIRTNPKELQQ